MPLLSLPRSLHRRHTSGKGVYWAPFASQAHEPLLEAEWARDQQPSMEQGSGGNACSTCSRCCSNLARFSSAYDPTLVPPPYVTIMVVQIILFFVNMSYLTARRSRTQRIRHKRKRRTGRLTPVMPQPLLRFLLHLASGSC